MCGANGCWEAYVSNIATLSRYFGRDLSKTAPELLLAGAGSEGPNYQDFDAIYGGPDRALSIKLRLQCQLTRRLAGVERAHAAAPDKTPDWWKPSGN
jgi:hypothetical protein